MSDLEDRIMEITQSEQQTEAEEIKKRCQDYTEELYKKDLHDTDNHEGVITPRARSWNAKSSEQI